MSTQSEFKLHHDVKQLMSTLRVPSERRAEVITDQLKERIGSHQPITGDATETALHSLTENSPSASSIMTSFNNLRDKATPNLNEFVSLMSLISKDPSVKEMLKRDAAVFENDAQVSLGSVDVSALEANSTFKNLTNKSHSDIQKDFQLKLELSPSKKTAYSFDVPPIPNWVFNNKLLSYDFAVDDMGGSARSLAKQPSSVQEHVLIQDCLWCLTGISGIYVKSVLSSDGDVSFNIDSTVQLSLRELVKTILPLCQNYHKAISFVEERWNFTYGKVNHALVAAIDSLLKDYMCFVSQLDQQYHSGQLSLQKMRFYVQPVNQIFHLVGIIVDTLKKNNHRGGQILTTLHNLIMKYSCDESSKQLLSGLTKAACKPYFEMLTLWVSNGVIHDPFEEFFIRINKRIKAPGAGGKYSDFFWDRYYQLLKDQVPVFLSQYSDIIYRTGKYLNVVRECRSSMTASEAGTDLTDFGAVPEHNFFPKLPELAYSERDQDYSSWIMPACEHANHLVVKLLLREGHLISHLNSVESIFLLSASDFASDLLEVAAQQLKLDVSDVNATGLQTLVEHCLDTCSVRRDPNLHERLKVELRNDDTISQLCRIITIETSLEKSYIKEVHSASELSVLEAFTLSYRVDGPVSLVLHHKVLAKYQILFRHIFYVKHVEKLIGTVWKRDQLVKHHGTKNAVIYARAFSLRQRMLAFVQALLYHTQISVVQPAWHKFQQKLIATTKRYQTFVGGANASNEGTGDGHFVSLDKLLAAHNDLLTSCFVNAMLIRLDLLTIIYKLLACCVLFYNHIQSIHNSIFADTSVACANDSFSGLEPGGPALIPSLTSKLWLNQLDEVAQGSEYTKTVEGFSNNFDRLMTSLIDTMGQSEASPSEPALLEFIHLLDFNGFYARRAQQATEQARQPPTQYATPSSQPANEDYQPGHTPLPHAVASGTNELDGTFTKESD